MELNKLLAIVEIFINEKISDISVNQGKRGLRGPKGLEGNEGSTGKDGESFIWDNHKEEIFNEIEKFRLSFSDLTDIEKGSLKGDKGSIGKSGRNGRDGIDGESFSWDQYKEQIFNRIDENKLSFSDLTRCEKAELKGDRGIPGRHGQDGEPGKDGKSLSWDDCKEEILSKIKDNKLTFSQFTDLEVKEITGERGPRGFKGSIGRDGYNFVWNEHKEEILNRVDEVKFKYSDFTDEELLELKGEKGPRGQRGKAGYDGLSAYEFWLRTNEGSKEDFLNSLVGKNGLDGIPGIRGISGAKGENGLDGIHGEHGIDAPNIVDVLIREESDQFFFVFLFSNGRRVETTSINKPRFERIIAQTIISSSGSGSGGLGALSIYKDDLLIGESEGMNFEGDNINVTFDALTKIATITVDDPVIPDSCIEISDEGSLITDCVKGIDFIGEGVEVISGTFMSDWATLTEVTTMSGYEVTNPGHVKVSIPSVSSKLGLTRVASEAISQFDLVRLISSTEVAKGSSDSGPESKISGIALNAAAIGEDVQVVMFGIVEDVSFTFTLLAKLFLQSDGSLGETPPSLSGEYIVVTAQSLGAGAVFIKIEEPEGIV